MKRICFFLPAERTVCQFHYSLWLCSLFKNSLGKNSCIFSSQIIFISNTYIYNMNETYLFLLPSRTHSVPVPLLAVAGPRDPRLSAPPPRDGHAGQGLPVLG